MSVILLIVLVITALRGLYLLHGYFVLPGGHDSSHHRQESVMVAYTLMENPGLLPEIMKASPVRYSPLTYFTYAFVNALSHKSFMSFALNIWFLWALSLACAAGVGWTLMPRQWPMILPAAALIATPAFWVIGVSYNLETCLIAGAAVYLLLFVNAEKLNRWYWLAPACLVAFACAMSKTIVLLAAFPAAVLFCLDPDRSVAWRRLALAAFMGLSFFLWLALHDFQFVGEIKEDYISVPLGGPLYYPRLLLFGYRGGALLAALAAVMIVRLKMRKLDFADLAFASWLIAPFVFFSALDTKREWYMLGAWLVVPVWFLYGARQLWEVRPIRFLTYAVSGLYLLLALGSSASVIANVNFAVGRFDKIFAGIPGDFPKVQKAEKFVAEQVLEIMAEDPAATLAVDHSRLQIAEERIVPLIMAKKPRVALVKPVVMTDCYCNKRTEFLEALTHSTYVLTINEKWPDFRGDSREAPDCAVLPREEIGRRVQAMRDNYVFVKSVPMADDNFPPVRIYKNIHPEKTRLTAEFVDFGGGKFHWATLGDFDSYGLTALRKEEYEKALAAFRLMQNRSLKYGAPGVARTLARMGDDEAFELHVFSVLRGASNKDKGPLLVELSRLEKRGELTPAMADACRKYMRR